MKPLTLYPLKSGVTRVTRVTQTNNPLYLLIYLALHALQSL